MSDAVDAQLSIGADAAAKQDREGEYRAIIAALLLGLERATTEELQLALLRSVRVWGGRTALSRGRSVLLPLLRSPNASVQRAVAVLFWILRRFEQRSLTKEERAVLQQVFAHGEEATRFYAALALIQDAGDERPAFLSFLRSATVPSNFLLESFASDTIVTSCSTASRFPKEENVDTKELRHVGSHCCVCGSVNTQSTYCRTLRYSIGIIEEHEVHCEECAFYTLHTIDI